jgi:hypothetical protein
MQPPKEKPTLKDVKVKAKPKLASGKVVKNASEITRVSKNVKAAGKEIANQKHDEKTPDEYLHNRVESVGKEAIVLAERKGRQATIEFIKRSKSKQKVQAQTKQEQQRNASVDQFAKKQYAKRKASNAIHTGKGHKIKTRHSPVKQSNRTVKNVSKGIKNSKQSGKKAKTSVTMMKKTAVATKKAAESTARAVKAIYMSVKALFASLKALITALIAGGWVVIVIILVVGVIAILLASPFGLFFNEGNDEHPSLEQVVDSINVEYTGKINKIIIDAGDVDEIIFDGESDSAMYMPSNWIDVLAVFAVKGTTSKSEDYMDMLLMDEKKTTALDNMFWDMNSIDYEIIETQPEPTPTPSSEPTESPEPAEPIRTLIITTNHINHIEASDMYRFDETQSALLDELLSGQYHYLLMQIIGMDSFSGLTPEQLENLVNNLPVGTKGAEIVRFALSRLGDPYSQSLRGKGNYVDCSYLTRWAYQQAGVSHFTAPTAASQAEYCINNGLSISKAALLPGDLVFWSHKANGRFMNITHTGVYAGGGKVIDASFSRGMVVYRPLFDADKQVVYARPHVK